MIELALTLPCGYRLANRLCKAAMTEGLADPRGRATPAHQRLYSTWGKGGAALHISGNIMVDRHHLERAGNVVVEDAASLPTLRPWVDAVHAHGSQLWGQISHPGRQCTRLINRTPLSPSDVQLSLAGFFGKPRAMADGDIEDVIARFARTAGVLKAAGFDGVQIHSAHGYLLSQFLSPRVNRRTDRWGGSLANRARLLLAIVGTVREIVGDNYPISVKLNSSDFVQGGFTLDECIEVVSWLSEAGIDLLEISGGTYEQLEFFKAQDASEVRDSTRDREAMFLQYADSIKAAARMPVMVTGGFRTRAGMEAALRAGHTDLIGLARPFCLDPDFPARMLAGMLDTLPIPEDRLVLGRGLRGPNSRLRTVRAFNNQAQGGWYDHQIERLGADLPVEPELSPWRALLSHFRKDFQRAQARRRAMRDLVT